MEGPREEPSPMVPFKGIPRFTVSRILRAPDRRSPSHRTLGWDPHLTAPSANDATQALSWQCLPETPRLGRRTLQALARGDGVLPVFAERPILSKLKQLTEPGVNGW